MVSQARIRLAAIHFHYPFLWSLIDFQEQQPFPPNTTGHRSHPITGALLRIGLRQFQPRREMK